MELIGLLPIVTHQFSWYKSSKSHVLTAHCFYNDSILQHARMVPMGKTVRTHARKTAEVQTVIT